MSVDRQEGIQRARWGWVIGWFAGGMALIVLALWVEDRWNWQGALPSVLVNVGTAFGLAGWLALLERRFSGTVVRANERVIRQAAQQVEERLQERTDQLAARIDDLQAEVEQRMQQRAREQDTKISALRDSASYRTITEALTEANQLAAIYDGGVTVQASQDPDGIRLVFSWAEDLDRAFEDLRPRGPHLDVEVDGEPDIAVEWDASEHPAAIGERLITALQTAGRWDGSGTLDWALALRNLQRSLGIAVPARRRDPNAWKLHGSLIELIGDDWAITDAGLECPKHGYLFSRAEFSPPFPQTRGTADRRGKPSLAAASAIARGAPPPDWRPEPPPWADGAEWDRLIERGRKWFVAPLLPEEVTRVPWRGPPEHPPE